MRRRERLEPIRVAREPLDRQVAAPPPLIASDPPRALDLADAEASAPDAVAADIPPVAEPAPVLAAPSQAQAATPPEEAQAKAATPPEEAKAQAAAAPNVAPVEPDPGLAVPSRWRDHTVKKGEALSQVLKTLGVDKADRAKVVAAAKGTTALTKLKAGVVKELSVAPEIGLMMSPDMPSYH